LKNCKYILSRAVAALLIFVFFTGCSTSTRSQRYSSSKNNEAKTSKPASQRYDKQNSEENLVVNDVADSNSEEFDELPVEENPVDKSKFIANYDKLKDFNVPLTNREKILFEVIKLVRMI